MEEDPGGKFEFKVKIDGLDRTTGVMLWPAEPDPYNVFEADEGPIKRADDRLSKTERALRVEPDRSMAPLG
jgi:hypothetical protein